jgi:hypothetical protein
MTLLPEKTVEFLYLCCGLEFTSSCSYLSNYNAIDLTESSLRVCKKMIAVMYKLTFSSK